MAQTITCDFCGQSPGVILVTVIGTGDTTSPCQECMGFFLASMAQMFGLLQDASDEPDGQVPTEDASAPAEPAADDTGATPCPEAAPSKRKDARAKLAATGTD